MATDGCLYLLQHHVCVLDRLWTAQQAGLAANAQADVPVQAHRVLEVWNNSVGQYSLLSACLHSQRKGVWRLPLPGWIMGFLIRNRITRHRILPEEVKRSIYVFLKNGLARVRYGDYSLEKNGLQSVLRLSARPAKLSATTAVERILMWHIATQVCDLLSQGQLGSEPSGSPVKKEHLVATTLSAYCAYLVSSAPELLPEHSYDTRLLLDGVQTEAREALKGCLSLSRDGTCDKLKAVQVDPSSGILRAQVHLGRRHKARPSAARRCVKHSEQVGVSCRALGGAASLCCAIGQRDRSRPEAGKRWRAHHAPLGTPDARRSRREALHNNRKLCLRVCSYVVQV